MQVVIEGKEITGKAKYELLALFPWPENIIPINKFVLSAECTHDHLFSIKRRCKILTQEIEETEIQAWQEATNMLNTIFAAYNNVLKRVQFVGRNPLDQQIYEEELC